MENIENNAPEEVLIFNPKEINGYLMETSKWAKFLAIMGYIGMGILVLIALGVMVASSVASQFANTAFPIGLLGFIYILMAALYYFPVTYLYRFATRVKEGINSQVEQSITSGFENLKSLFKFMGIFTIVILSIYVLALLLIVPITMYFTTRGM
ncbi:hypothetical protein ACUNWD_05205 [Sunxiuqinia sp. A32]|uniref:hypothetical protein n=1 Tax=Sunxiuqinia sp. A32 TaxID=3461496 RepID=UPI004045EF75